jgi:hypothetical protein
MFNFLKKIFLKEKNNKSNKEKVLSSSRPKAKKKSSKRNYNSELRIDRKEKKKPVAKVDSSTTSCLTVKQKCAQEVKNKHVLKTDRKLKRNKSVAADDQLSVEVKLTPSKDALTNKLSFRVNLDELQKLKRYVKDNHSTTSAVLRSLVQEIESSKRCTDSLYKQNSSNTPKTQILHELKRQGNNLNQSVRVLNTLNKNLNDEDEIQASHVLKELNITLIELKKMFALFVE